MRHCPWQKTSLQLNLMGPESDTSIGIQFTASDHSLLTTHTNTEHCLCVCVCVYQPLSDHGSTAGVFVCVCVYVDLESRELMQAGLWQSSCPSARLIMQERHSRPSFILPGGEAVPACSLYHMALAPLSSLFSHSFSLYWGCCGWSWWWRRGWAIGDVVERHGTQYIAV